MGLKKGQTSLRGIFLKYFLAIIGISLVQIIVFLLLLFSIMESGLVLPANNAEFQLKSLQANSNQAVRVTELPLGTNYALFDVSQIIKQSDMSSNLKKEAQLFLKKGNQASQGYFIKIERQEGTYVVHYDLRVHYGQAWLEEHLSNFEFVWVTMFIITWFLFFALVTIRFAHYVKRQMAPLVELTEKIGQQDLEFSVANTQIKEFNALLESINGMKDSLKESLMKNWLLEEERKEQLSALTHDLKTPLTVIKGNTELLTLTDLSAQQASYVQFSLKNITKVEAYLTELRQLTMTQSLTTLERRPVKGEFFLNKLSEETNALALACGRQLSIEKMCRGDFVLDIDIALMTRAVMNIVSNALDYSAKNSDIHLIFQCDGVFLKLVCENEGIGFSPEALLKGKRLFYRADSSRSQTDHLGMGLYIADNIVSKHDGRLILENHNSGARVTITLPIKRLKI